jgi:hypothetical protein
MNLNIEDSNLSYIEYPCIICGNETYETDFGPFGVCSNSCFCKISDTYNFVDFTNSDQHSCIICSNKIHETDWSHLGVCSYTCMQLVDLIKSDTKSTKYAVSDSEPESEPNN